MKLEMSSIGGGADMGAGGDNDPEVIKLEQTRARAIAVESRSSAEAMEPRNIADGMEASCYSEDVQARHRAGETAAHPRSSS